jgi:hypothetical protein
VRELALFCATYKSIFARSSETPISTHELALFFALKEIRFGRNRDSKIPASIRAAARNTFFLVVLQLLQHIGTFQFLVYTCVSIGTGLPVCP